MTDTRPLAARLFLARFGRRLKLLRVERDFSQEEFGRAAGMHRTFIGQLEHGVNIDRLPDLAGALGVDEHELIPRRPDNQDQDAEQPAARD